MCGNRRPHDHNLKSNLMCGTPTNCSVYPGRSIQMSRCFLLGLVAVFAFLRCSAGTALASCGDYLHQGRDLHNAQSMHVDSSSIDLTSQMQLPSDPATPCSGPHCRSNSTPVAPASAPGFIHWNSETAALLETRLVKLAEGSTRISLTSRIELTSGGCSIFRPPCV